MYKFKAGRPMLLSLRLSCGRLFFNPDSVYVLNLMTIFSGEVDRAGCVLREYRISKKGTTPWNLVTTPNLAEFSAFSPRLVDHRKVTRPELVTNLVDPHGSGHVV